MNNRSRCTTAKSRIGIVLAAALLLPASSWTADHKSAAPAAGKSAAPAKSASPPAKAEPSPAHTSAAPAAGKGTHAAGNEGPVRSGGLPSPAPRPNPGGSHPGPAAAHNSPPSRTPGSPNTTVEHVRARPATTTHSVGDRVVNRPDHSVIVSSRAGHGYLQRPFTYRGQALAHRTYYDHGVAYSRFYRPYTYHGVVLQGYIPTRYYTSAFYGWAYHPWRTRVNYYWGWVASPWYGYYGGYFAPAPYYSSANLWLTDYMISRQLSAAYDDRGNATDAPSQNFDGGQITPEVKEAIAAEVQRQLALENQEREIVVRNQMGDPASSGIQRLLSDNRPHTFLVSSSLEVVNARGQTCAISRGDVLQLNAPPPSNSSTCRPAGGCHELRQRLLSRKHGYGRVRGPAGNAQSYARGS